MGVVDLREVVGGDTNNGGLTCATAGPTYAGSCGEGGGKPHPYTRCEVVVRTNNGGMQPCRLPSARVGGGYTNNGGLSCATAGPTYPGSCGEGGGKPHPYARCEAVGEYTNNGVACACIAVV